MLLSFAHEAVRAHSARLSAPLVSMATTGTPPHPTRCSPCTMPHRSPPPPTDTTSTSGLTPLSCLYSSKTMLEWPSLDRRGERTSDTHDSRPTGGMWMGRSAAAASLSDSILKKATVFSCSGKGTLATRSYLAISCSSADRDEWCGLTGGSPDVGVVKGWDVG